MIQRIKEWIVRWLLEPEIDAIYELLAAQQVQIDALRKAHEESGQP